MKKYLVLMLVLSLNAVAGVDICNYATRADVGSVTITKSEGDKVVIKVKNNHYSSQNAQEYEFVGYEIVEDTPFGGLYVLNQEKLYKLIDENGLPAELTITKEYTTSHSRVPCYQGRVDLEYCANQSIIFTTFKLDSIDFKFGSMCKGFKK
jgi:hypothetical protein